MDVEKLIKAGSQLSLKGEALQAWVEAQIKSEAEKKEREAALEKERRKEEREIEKERIREERERDIERQQRVREENDNLRLQLELEAMRSQRVTSLTPERQVAPHRNFNMQSFDESQDKMDCYLTRFERLATMNGLDRLEWATHLSACLKGKSLEVYTRMDYQDSLDYEMLKRALLKRYNLTDEGFALRFRSSRPDGGERFSQFVTRITGYLNKWIEMTGKDKTNSEDIIDLFVREQLMNTCSKDLTVFLKERRPGTTDEMVELVENYIEAHGIAGAFSKGQSNQNDDKGAHVHKKQAPINNDPSTDTKLVSCQRCGRSGHMAQHCKTPAQGTSILRCDYCRNAGHTVQNCHKKKRDKAQHYVAVAVSVPSCEKHNEVTLAWGGTLQSVMAAQAIDLPFSNNMPVAAGTVNGLPVTVLRDSGCSTIIVRKGLVPGKNTIKRIVPVRMVNGTVEEATVTEITLVSPYYSGTIGALEMESPLYDVIIGNIPGAKSPDMALEALAVETRGSAKEKIKSLLTPPASGADVTVKTLINNQNNDDTLAYARALAVSGEKRSRTNSQESFGYESQVLYRYFTHKIKNNGDTVKQLVLPKDLRPTVLRVAHESILAGHLATKKTFDRIVMEFHWPGIYADVKRFVQSCDNCQRSAPKGRTSKVPVTEVPLIQEPFKRIAVDIIGPILPSSERKYKYILTVVDYCTRYPEAVALKNIDTETVAEALVDIFSRIGIPQEILSDRGSQFTSDLMKEICRLLSVKQLMTTPYHPQCNGLVERFNGTLKGMLKRLATDRPKDWDRYINAALFAYREAPQESLGFSPFELLYARPVRGPMTILRELWTNNIEDEEVKTTYQYVVDLREKMEAVIDIAHQNLKSASAKQKAHFDKSAKQRSFQIGDKVLLLLPTKNNKLQLKWQGPFVVIDKKHTNNYKVDLGKTQRTYHINMLKRYFERVEEEPKGVLACAVAAVVTDNCVADSESSERDVAEYRFTLRSLKGSDNHGPDFLSRDE